MKNNTVEEIVKKLRNVSDMISMGEKIMWGDDTRLMYQAANLIETLTQHHQNELREVYREILEEQSTYDNYNNTHCYQAVSVKNIRALAQNRGIDISDNKTENV